MLHRGRMFERFTDRARRSIVLAQEEARQLHHNYIGTEHVLLGLLAEEQGLAARAAQGFGLTLAVGREDVLAIIGRGKQELRIGHIPFTPRAKKCLELALREALQLDHDYIGTEHILLGIVREGEGVGAHILRKHARSLGEVRQAVIDLLPAATAEAERRRLLRRLAGRRTTAVQLRPEPPEQRTTPAADASLAEAARLAGAGALGSHHILLAALVDPNTAAARALVSLGVDLDRAREVLRAADVTGSSDELPEEAGRRQMLITVTDDRLTLEATDTAIIQLGRAAADALRARLGAPGQPGESGETGESGSSAETTSAGQSAVIRGDDPVSGSLGLVWQALHDSLEDIRCRAAASPAAKTAAAGQTTAPVETPAPSDAPRGGEAADAPRGGEAADAPRGGEAADAPAEEAASGD
jgi:ATP-dependent Clp protease ATP-binding subunit ClpA